MNMDVIKLFLPYMKRMDPKWKAVDYKNFSKNNFKAHSSLYEALRAALRKPDQLKEEIKQKREAEELEPESSSQQQSESDQESVDDEQTSEY